VQTAMLSTSTLRDGEEDESRPVWPNYHGTDTEGPHGTAADAWMESPRLGLLAWDLPFATCPLAWWAIRSSPRPRGTPQLGNRHVGQERDGPAQQWICEGIYRVKADGFAPNHTTRRYPLLPYFPVSL
jgi:hypothetical protein